jgi:hypothetical protein
MRRETDYQSALGSYSEPLTPGMTRKEVEDYLRAKNTEFRQQCCFGVGDNTPDDLTKVGQEDGPWYCSRTNVYVAFKFTAVERHAAVKAYDSDKLERVAILRWPEDCL